MNNNLFENSKTDAELVLQYASKINGLEIHFDYISEEEENNLLSNIDKNNWLTDLTRRVQHYGYKYDYKASRIDPSFFIGEIPSWINNISERLKSEKLIDFNPDQAIINEYIENQGIAAHIDCKPCFNDTIVSLSLSGSCVMDFIKDKNSDNPTKVSLLIPPRTLIIMKGESRYNWHHAIPSRKKDVFNSTVYNRSKRVSVTLRKVIV
ncbi:alpha-ketoglutarate-dependent dioxygenase AlkB [Flavobacterium sp.]|uniref:alpha-ketoglutarate-dependent dioxygenase AlkB n=1 Tax=Flavobacterium sp. TaxID=239 RepID=UPI0037C1A55C